MESMNSSSCEAQASVKTASSKEITEQWFSDQFEDLLPKIQEQWPEVAKQTLEATRGSLMTWFVLLHFTLGKHPMG